MHDPISGIWHLHSETEGPNGGPTYSSWMQVDPPPTSGQGNPPPNSGASSGSNWELGRIPTG